MYLFEYNFVVVSMCMGGCVRCVENIVCIYIYMFDFCSCLFTIYNEAKWTYTYTYTCKHNIILLL